MTPDPGENRDLSSLFGEATQIYVGVAAARGPHVTPELFAVSGGRLWCMTASGTLKAKVLSRDDRVAFMAYDGDRVVIGTGRATVMDPLRPASLLDAATVAQSPLGAAKFVGRNLQELAGAARDALTGKLGLPLPPHRVLLSIEPVSAASVDQRGVVESWGWERTADDRAAYADDESDDVSIDLSELPVDLAALAVDGTAALGWSATDGHPLVLPAAWERDRSRVRVGRSLFEQCGAASSSRAALTMDGWTGYGPTGKQGVLLRGRGTASDDAGDVAVALDFERATYWDGVDTTTATI